MAMLPIFAIGVFIGWFCAATKYQYMEDSFYDYKIKVKMIEAKLLKEKSDNEMLHELINKLYDKIDKLSRENDEEK